IEAPPPRPGQVMRQLHYTAWRPSQVTERRRQGLLDATPARGQIPLAASTVHGAILPRIEGTIEPKRRTARPRNPRRGGVTTPWPSPGAPASITTRAAVSLAPYAPVAERMSQPVGPERSALPGLAPPAQRPDGEGQAIRGQA